MPAPGPAAQSGRNKFLLTHWSEAMSTLERIARYGAIVGFLFVSSGCVVADGGYGHDHDRYVREHRDHEDRDHRDRDERHCADRDHDGECDHYR